MAKLIAILVIAAICLATCDELHDRNLKTPDYIDSRGFDCETHEVTTNDGYVLSIHRIVNPLIQNAAKKPVILQHGLLGDSAGWLINSEGPNLLDYVQLSDEEKSSRKVGNNLGFELSLKGYDVWMPNSRGNTYSLKHLNLTVTDNKFWDFSIDEKIKFDQPAIIDYVLRTTGHSTVGYVGHSMGTMTMFGLLATQTRFNNIIKPFVALAPVTTVAHIKSPITYLANGFVLGLLQNRQGRFLPNSQITRLLATACPERFAFICQNLIFLIAGFNEKQFNRNRTEVYFSHMPAGTSWKNMIHFAKNYNSKNFVKFDYGKAKNLEVYGQRTPPVYPIRNITCSTVALISSENDWLAAPADVATLRSRLKVDLIDDYVVPLKKWNHLDFVLAKEAGKYINTRVLRLLDEHA